MGLWVITAQVTCRAVLRAPAGKRLAPMLPVLVSTGMMPGPGWSRSTWSGTHDGGTAAGEFCFILTVTDIATGWTVNRSVRNKAQRWVFEALEHAVAQFPFPISGIDSDNGGEFINTHVLRYCERHRITFTRSPAYNKKRRLPRGAEELGAGA